MISNPESVLHLTFHREQVAARRLVKRTGLSLTTALEQILCERAGDQGLAHLLDQRRVHFSVQAERKAQQRDAVQRRHMAKLNTKAVPVDRWCGWFDGSAKPNPGDCAIGGLLQSPNGQCWEIARTVGYGNSSSAEYLALIAVLELALKLDVRSVTIFGDSRVVIDDLRPQIGASAHGLETYRRIATDLMQQIPKMDLQWIPRARNVRADALAQQAFKNFVPNSVLDADICAHAKCDSE
nr:ribonuclease HI family protein [uncultured Undibacterium sp.]